MRSTNLLRIAAEAEILRIRTMIARQLRRVVFAVVAAVFLLGLLVSGEVAGWQVLRLYVEPIYATLIVMAVNLVIAALFGSVAAWSSPNHAEREALRVRQQALGAARGALSVAAAIPLARTVLRAWRRRGGQ